MSRAHLWGRIALPLFAASLLPAAAPWIMIVSGSPLKQSVVIDRWDQNLRFLIAAAVNKVDVDSNSLRERPYFDLSLYWGDDWKEFLDKGGRPASLRRDQANQYGRFYPALGNLPAIVELDDVDPPYRSISDDGLKMLTDLGVPVSVNR